MTKLFGTSGIRGSVTEKVTVDLALDLGRALGTYLQCKGKVGVGNDARTSRKMLTNAFISGVLSTGIDVVDLGFAPMPVVASHSTRLDVDVSVIITASHNPPTDNGFKFFTGGREFIRTEEKALESCIAGRRFTSVSWDRTGNVSEYDIRQDYIAMVLSFVTKRGSKSKGTRVLVDMANGAAVPYTPHILRNLGFRVTTINSHPDGHFPGRAAEPSPRNLGDTMEMMNKSDFAVGLCHDGDGDRLAVIDEDGNFIDQNRVIALFAEDEVRREGGGTVVVSIDTSSVIDELVKRSGGTVVRLPLGSLQEEFAKDSKDKIVFASEPWKPIFTDYGLWMDGIVGAVRLAQMVDEIGGSSCKELMKSVPEYPVLRDFVPCPDPVKKDFIPKVKELLLPEVSDIEQVIEVDGIRIERSDGSYVLVRVSGTEPKARVYIGARSQSTVDRLSEKTKGIMKNVLDELHG